MANTYASATEVGNIYTNIASSTLYVSLHTASPGLTGANEISTGGSPSYGRASCAFGAATTGSSPTVTGPSSGSLSIGVRSDAGGSATYFGIWSASTGGTYLFGGPLGTSVPAGSTATIATNQITISMAS